jgi:hypothetical protein
LQNLFGRGPQKKAQPIEAAQNPPKEEGGGDKPWSFMGVARSARYGSDYRGLFCAMQEKHGAVPHQCSYICIK